jgi:hypothetical protein
VVDDPDGDRAARLWAIDYLYPKQRSGTVSLSVVLISNGQFTGSRRTPVIAAAECDKAEVVQIFCRKFPFGFVSLSRFKLGVVAAN